MIRKGFTFVGNDAGLPPEMNAGASSLQMPQVGNSVKKANPLGTLNKAPDTSGKPAQDPSGPSDGSYQGEASKYGPGDI